VGARRALVADDQADILHAFRLLLGDAGFDSELVTSTDGAIDRVWTGGSPQDDATLSVVAVD
jgi:hypothetical protein